MKACRIIIASSICCCCLVVLSLPQRSAAFVTHPVGGVGQSPASFRKTPNKKSISIRHPTTLTELKASPTTTTTTAVLVVGHVLGGLLGVPVVAGATSTWYRKIHLPTWTPPNRLFGPVWTLLYSSMGISVSRVLQRLPAATGGACSYWSNIIKEPAIAIWCFHFLLNIVWAPVFFGMKRLRLGLWINHALIVSLGLVFRLFYENNPLSCFILLPYMAWLIFATILNWAICAKNPGNYNNAMFQADLDKLQKDAANYVGL